MAQRTVSDVQIIDFIEDYKKRHGKGPSYQAIAAVMGMNKSSLWVRMRAMRELGLVDWPVNRFCDIEILSREPVHVPSKPEKQRPKPRNLCSVAGCMQRREEGDQFCCEHGDEFVRRYRKAWA